MDNSIKQRSPIESGDPVFMYTGVFFVFLIIEVLRNFIPAAVPLGILLCAALVSVVYVTGKARWNDSGHSSRGTFGTMSGGEIGSMMAESATSDTIARFHLRTR